VFEQVEEAIILEDDCLPHPTFFRFCDEMLARYRNDKRIGMISGDNFQFGRNRNEDSYYFSKYVHIWGWASWRDRWEDTYDVELKKWPLIRDGKWLINILGNAKEVRYWSHIFEKTFQGKVDTWDYQWHASICHYGGLTVTPNVNLVSNIGFGPNATNFKSFNSPLARIATSSLGEIIHPKAIVQDQAADRFVFKNVYSARLKKFPLNLIVIIYFLVKKFINRNQS
jgi:hypothetical protein